MTKKDAEGFIKLNALRLRIAAQKGRQHQIDAGWYAPHYGLVG